MDFAVAAALLAQLPPERWDPAAREWLQAHQRETWVLAVSGGADSLALAIVLRAAFPATTMLVAGFDHGWRAEAKMELAAVAAMAAALEMPFVRGACAQDAPAATTEDAARQARWSFLERVAKEHQATAILSGHHADDVAETMVMRLARGSGLDGLSGPRPVQPIRGEATRVKPFLTLRHHALTTGLDRLGLAWAEDPSNAEPIFTRNRVRADVLPRWDAAVPHDVVGGMSRAHRLLQEADDALNLWADQAPESDDRDAVVLGWPAQTPRAVARRRLERWLRRRQLNGVLSARHQDALLDAWEASARWAHVLAGGQLTVEAEKLRWEPESVEAPAEPWGPLSFPAGRDSLSLPSGASLGREAWEVSPAARAELENGAIDPAREVWLQLPPRAMLTVRSWQPGDRYQPLGSPGTRKLQDLFTDAKVALVERHRLPVVCYGSPLAPQIAWVPGFPPAELLRLPAQASLALRLTYRPT